MESTEELESAWAHEPPVHFASREGMNMGVWIGFKHVNSLIDRGISDFLRRHGASVRSLFWGSDACLQFDSSKVRYETALTADEPVRVRVDARQSGLAGVEFIVEVVSERLGAEVRVARCRYHGRFLSRSGRLLEQRPGPIDRLFERTCDGD